MTEDDKKQSRKIVNSLWDNDLVETKKNLTDQLLTTVQTFLVGKKKDISKNMFKDNPNEKN